MEYNSRWLPKTRQGEKKSVFDFQAINPVEVWQEDAWTFVRRMCGYDLVQKLFYEFMTRTWILLDIDKGKELRNHQDALIDSVFGHRDIEYFVKIKRRTLLSRPLMDITQVFWPITSLNAWEGRSVS